MVVFHLFLNAGYTVETHLGWEENHSRLKVQNTRQKRFLRWRVLTVSSSKSHNFPMCCDMIYTISNVIWLKPSQKNCVQVPDVSPRIVISHYQQNVTRKAVEETFSTTTFLRSVTNECVGRWLLCSDRNLFKAIIIKPMNTTLCTHYLHARFSVKIPEFFCFVFPFRIGGLIVRSDWFSLPSAHCFLATNTHFHTW